MIITAADVERETVLRELHPNGRDGWTRLTTVADGLWEICQYHSNVDPRISARLVLARTRVMGLSATAGLTALGIQLFRPTHIAMLGITAGRPSKTQIGDVLIPQEIWDYGAGKWEERSGKVHFVARGEHQSLDEHVRQWCDNLARREEDLTSIRRNWLSRHAQSSGVSVPTVRMGPMVSGAAVVNAEAIWTQVIAQNDKIIGLDMEAYAFALASECAATPQYSPSWLVAKSVCDFGIVKQDDAQAYAAYTSVQFFKLYLDQYILDWMLG